MNDNINGNYFHLQYTLNMMKYCYPALLLFAGITLAETPSKEELWEIIQQQQKTIESLQERLDQNEQRLKNREQSDHEEEKSVTVVDDERDDTQKTQLGGYGELHYNNRDGDDELDLHRFVITLGYAFTDRISFESELEFESVLTGDDAPGEVKVEEAWLEFAFLPSHEIGIGIQGLPIGIINQHHRPNRFYGVERPELAIKIIPAAWTETGIGLSGVLFPDWYYSLMAHTGLRLFDNSNNVHNNIRDGRQDNARANPDHPAFTSQLRYTGIDGLELGGSLQYQTDVTAGIAANAATFFNSYANFSHHSGFDLRAVYAQWNLNEILVAPGDDKQYGYYIEPSYRTTISDAAGDLGIFSRWTKLEYGDGAILREEEYVKLGINYWPIDSIVFKFDWFHMRDIDFKTSENGFNLGFGYSF